MLLRRGVEWLRGGTVVLSLTTVLSTIVRLGSSILLARLLAPDAFGIVAIVISVVAMLSLASDMGFHAFIVRHERGDQPDFLDCVWTIRLIRSVILAVIVVAGSKIFASLYSQPDLWPAIAFGALFVLLEGVSSLGLIVATRRERVAFVSLFEFWFGVLQAALTLMFAYWLRSYWAILLALVCGGLLKAVATFVLIPGSGVKFRYDRALAKELFRFSRFVIGSSIITLILSQADKVLLARVLSLTEFGLLMLAMSMVQAASSFASTYVIRAFYPVMARLHRSDPKILAIEYYKLRRVVALLFAFCVGGVVGGADLIIRLIFDDRYLGAGLYLSILALAPAAAMNASFAEQALVAIGRVQETLYFNLIRLGYLATIGLGAFLFVGPIGFLVALATMDYPPMLVGWLKLAQLRMLRLSEEAAFWGTFAMGVCAGWAAFQAAMWLVSAGWLPDF